MSYLWLRWSKVLIKLPMIRLMGGWFRTKMEGVDSVMSTNYTV